MPLFAPQRLHPPVALSELSFLAGLSPLLPLHLSPQVPLPHPPVALSELSFRAGFRPFAAPSFASSPASPPATGFTSSVIPSAARNLLTTAWPRLHHAAQVKRPFLLLPSIHSPPRLPLTREVAGTACRRERPSPKLYLSPHQETYGQFSATYGPRPLPRPAGIIKVIQCGRAHALMVAGTFPPPLAAATPQHPPTHVRLKGTLSPYEI